MENIVSSQTTSAQNACIDNTVHEETESRVNNTNNSEIEILSGESTVCQGNQQQTISKSTDSVVSNQHVTSETSPCKITNVAQYELDNKNSMSCEKSQSFDNKKISPSR